MKSMILKISLVSLFVVIYSFSCKTVMEKDSVYHVARLTQPLKIDAVWDKTQWKNVKPLDITNYMGKVPGFKPVAQAKMMYDDQNLYVIFHVRDCCVRCITKEINGPVWEDGAVEFFFAPDANKPLLYFNLEVNCGGTPLMHYNLIPRSEGAEIPADDIKRIEIAHTLPQIIDPEMKEPVEWTLEYKIPIAMLERYSAVTQPKKGIVWKANFYKIAENSSNPHYITWSVVNVAEPDFHRPEFFGKIIFE
jgi:hypothetical protein